MFSLNLKKLLLPRKVWKLFTKKLGRSKGKRKPKIQSYKTSKKLGWPSLSIQPKKFKKKPNSHTLIHHKKHQFRFQKSPPLPVFIDQLFVESIPVEGGASCSKNSSSPSSRLKKSSNEGRRNMIMSPADEVWESMAMTSPQMDGIDEKAEEFIARFRAEMHHQEMLARRL